MTAHGDYQKIRVSTEGGVATVTLADPATLNAASLEIARELIHAFSSIAAGKVEARAVILTGEGRGFCSVPAFIIKGGREAGEKFVNATELHSHVANIGDVRSLIIHPGSTTHSQLNEAEQLASGVAPGLIRLSVGLETIGDIIADLELGFSAV